MSHCLLRTIVGDHPSGWLLTIVRLTVTNCVWKSPRLHVKISSVCIFRADGDAYRKRFLLDSFVNWMLTMASTFWLSLNRSPVVDQLANHSIVPGLQIRLAGHMATIRRCIPQPRSEKRYGTSIGEQCGFTRTPNFSTKMTWVKGM